MKTYYPTKSISLGNNHKAMDMLSPGPPVLDLRGPLPVPDIQSEVDKTRWAIPAQAGDKSERLRRRWVGQWQSFNNLTWWLRYSIGVAALVGMGLLSINLALGQWLVAGYALAAIIFRINSQYSFTLAILSLASVPLFLLTDRASLAENYAVYTYYFLVIGTVAAVREMLHSRSNISG